MRLYDAVVHGGTAIADIAMKVGELARRSGLTVRTLHHYDAIGLLSPSGRTDSLHGSGHRLYTPADLARLHQILCLRQLGFSLDDVRQRLTRDDYDPRAVVREHLAHTRRRAQELSVLVDRLGSLADTLDRMGDPTPEMFLQTIEAMTMFEKYYTPEQLVQLQERAKTIGQAALEEAPKKWEILFADVAAAMAAGVPPTDSRAHDLARRWLDLVSAFTGGDPGTFQSLQNMYQKEEHVAGMNVHAMRPTMDYIRQAADSAGIKHPGQ